MIVWRNTISLNHRFRVSKKYRKLILRMEDCDAIQAGVVISRKDHLEIVMNEEAANIFIDKLNSITIESIAKSGKV